MNFTIIINIILWVIFILLAWRAERAYMRMEELQPESNFFAMPNLSVIIPARNETKVLPALLNSLKEQHYPSPLEVVVVDDNSQDDTAKIAQSLGAKVISLAELPPGWLGKPHACQRGAESASGDWLLFTDADTIHQPEAAISAVGHAIRNNLDGLSLFPGHNTSGWYDAVVLGTAFTALFAGWGTMTNMFNGQFILVKKSIYLSTGGFSSVRLAAVEDVAFGARLQQQGFKTEVMRGELIASVHMYRSLTQLWYGIARLGSGTLTRSPISTLFMVLFIAQLTLPLTYALSSSLGLTSWFLPLLSWMIVAGMVVPWMRRIRSTGMAFLAPFGAVFIIIAAVWGVMQRATGWGITWKGRRV
jgi:cellulose synthase/poly-beta-1,6-N-acetylglucosamine synthase-like glycosyltransferase